VLYGQNESPGLPSPPTPADKNICGPAFLKLADLQKLSDLEMTALQIDMGPETYASKDALQKDYKRIRGQFEAAVESLDDATLKQEVQNWIDRTLTTLNSLPGLVASPEYNITSVDQLIRNEILDENGRKLTTSETDYFKNIIGNLDQGAAGTSMLDQMEVYTDFKVSDWNKFIAAYKNRGIYLHLVKELNKRVQAMPKVKTKEELAKDFFDTRQELQDAVELFSNADLKAEIQTWMDEKIEYQGYIPGLMPPAQKASIPNEQIRTVEELIALGEERISNIYANAGGQAELSLQGMIEEEMLEADAVGEWLDSWRFTALITQELRELHIRVKDGRIKPKPKKKIMPLSFDTSPSAEASFKTMDELTFEFEGQKLGIEIKVSQLDNESLLFSLQKWMDDWNKENGSLPGMSKDYNVTDVRSLIADQQILSDLIGNTGAAEQMMDLEVKKPGVLGNTFDELSGHFNGWKKRAPGLYLMQELKKRLESRQIR